MQVVALVRLILLREQLLAQQEQVVVELELVVVQVRMEPLILAVAVVVQIIQELAGRAALVLLL
jgi:hypothetical protein